MEDSLIVELYWQRNERAIVETQSKYGTYCHAIAYRILLNSEDTEECLNDTYIGAWNSMPPHRPVTLSTYLGKITRRLALKIYRGHMAAKRGNGGPSIYDTPEQDHIRLYMKDGTTIRLRLIEGGYVGYEHLGWYFVSMPGEAFDAVFQKCRE